MKTPPMLDDLLVNHFAEGETGENGEPTRRVIDALAARPLPPQRKPRWARLPTALLDWNFAPAWPRIGVLATAALIGFVIGLVGLDGQVDEGAAASATAAPQDDLGAILFDAAPITGWRP